MAARPLDTNATIESPEHVAFDVQVAGLTRRAYAFAADVVVQTFLLSVVGLTLLLLGATGLGDLGVSLIVLLHFLVTWFYFVAFELLTRGSSPGKKLFGLRVVSGDGLPITARASLLRNLVRAADLPYAPFFVGGAQSAPGVGLVPLGPMVMLLDRRSRRLGDLIANTMVIYERSPSKNKQVEFSPDEALVATLPKTLPLSRDDLHALQLFVHRTKITPDRREELARMVAPVYAERIGLAPPADATRFLTALWAKAQRRQS